MILYFSSVNYFKVNSTWSRFLQTKQVKIRKKKKEKQATHPQVTKSEELQKNAL